MRGLQPVELHRRGEPRGPARRDEARDRRRGARPRCAVRDPSVRHARAAAHHHRRGRVRPGLRRRRGARLGDPAQRRSRRRQIDPAAGRSGSRGPVGAARSLYLGRGGGRTDPCPGQADGIGAGAGGAGLGHGAAGHPRHPEARAVRHRHRRFHPDPLVRRPRGRPRLGDPGPRLRRRNGAAGQVTGRRRHPRRPRHQGRSGRRAACRRAYGRRRTQLRGRARLSVPHPARRQEPLRRHRRDRRVRNGRRRPARGRQSLRPLPRREQGSRAGRSGVRRHRGVTARAGRDAGARVEIGLWHPAPGRGGLGHRAAGHGSGGVGGALRLRVRGSGRLSERGRRPADQ